MGCTPYINSNWFSCDRTDEKVRAQQPKFPFRMNLQDSTSWSGVDSGGQPGVPEVAFLGGGYSALRDLGAAGAVRAALSLRRRLTDWLCLLTIA